MRHKVAIIGAMGARGRAILDCLAARGFSHEDVYALDFEKNIGCRIPYQDTFITTYSLETFDFSKTGLVFLCSTTFLNEYRDKILSYGQYIIDCAGILEEGPCVVYGLNKNTLRKYPIITNPTSLTIVLAHLLKPIHKAFHVRSVTATAMIPAGEFGQDCIQILVDQTRSLYTREAVVDGLFKKVQAFNLIPEIYPGLSRQTSEQLKSLFHIPVQIATCLAPIFQGECLYVGITTQKKALCTDLKNLFTEHTVCRVIDEMVAGLTISTQDTACSDNIYLTHCQTLPHQPNTYGLWVICDSVRLGAPLNAVRIAEHILS